MTKRAKITVPALVAHGDAHHFKGEACGICDNLAPLTAADCKSGSALQQLLAERTALLQQRDELVEALNKASVALSQAKSSLSRNADSANAHLCAAAEKLAESALRRVKERK